MIYHFIISCGPQWLWPRVPILGVTDRYKKMTQTWLLASNCFFCLSWNCVWENKAFSKRQGKQCYLNIKTLTNSCQEAICSHCGPERFVGLVHVQITQAWWLWLSKTHFWKFSWNPCPTWTFQTARVSLGRSR